MAKLVSEPYTCMSNSSSTQETFPLRALRARLLDSPACANIQSFPRRRGLPRWRFQRRRTARCSPLGYHTWATRQSRARQFGFVPRSPGQPVARGQLYRLGTRQYSARKNVASVRAWAAKNIFPGTVHNQTTRYKALIRKARCGAKEKHVSAYK